MEVLFILVGVAALAAGILLRMRWARERGRRVGWPRADGTIDWSRVTVEQSSGETGGSTERFTAAYSYVVDEVRHAGSVICDKAKHHKSLLAKYVAGTKADIFYDPLAPRISELRDPLVRPTGWAAGLGQLGLVLLLTGPIFAVTGVMMLMMT